METSELHILIVEDEASIRDLMEMEFQDLGYRSTAVGTVAEANQIIANRSMNIDLCIFDLRLPDGDGLSLLQRVKEQHPNMPVILMTGHGNKSTVIEALKRGAYDYIEKPFSIANDLFPVVHRAASAIRLQKENNALNEQILHHSKLAVLGELSATVLHDIRGPLSMILVVCEDIDDEIADRGIVSTELIIDNLSHIRKSCERIKKLVDHLRGYARQDTNDSIEWRDLEMLFADSMFLVQQKIRTHGITVNKQIPQELQNLQLKCFVSKFEQVIMNLVSNACDAMSTCPTRELTLTARLDAQFLYLEVTDTGIGMPKEIQEKIFDNFFTTKSRSEGTGLGLKIVRNIVREHGGELALHSEANVGTTFSIKIPRDSVQFKQSEESEINNQTAA